MRKRGSTIGLSKNKYIMKDLITTIKTDYYKGIYLESMRDVFGDDLPSFVMESADNGTYIDYVLETLTTHDVNMLKSKITDKFSHLCDMEFIPLNKKEQSFGIDTDVDLAKHDEFDKLIKFFGYYVTKTFMENGRYVIIISPNYAKDVNDMVYRKNHGKLYHFSSNPNSMEILRTGLRCKKSTYRDFPERIYLYSNDKPLDKIKDLENKISLVVDPFNARRYGVYVFRIDLNKMSDSGYINFYTDDMMGDNDAVYTYNNIPAKCIELVKEIKL